MMLLQLLLLIEELLVMFSREQRAGMTWRSTDGMCVTRNTFTASVATGAGGSGADDMQVCILRE